MPPVTFHSPGAEHGAPHFRAHERRRVRLSVVLRAEHGAWERPGTVINLHLAGAGLETDEPLVVGERVTIAFATPARWDPLVLPAVVAWAHPLAMTSELDARHRPRSRARSGLSFDYPTPDATLAMFEMLGAIGFE